MSRKENKKKIIEYVWQSMLGGLVIFGLSCSVSFVYVIKEHNDLGLFRYLCMVVFAPYFYKFFCNAQKDFMQMIFGLLRYGIGCWLSASLFLMVLINNFSMPVDVLVMGYGMDSFVSISASYFFAYGLFLIIHGGKQKNLEMQESSVDDVKEGVYQNG